MHRKQGPQKAGNAPYLAGGCGRGRALEAHIREVKKIYAKRKETIERVFADAEEKHGMCCTTLNGLEKLLMQAMLTFRRLELEEDDQLDMEQSNNSLKV